MVFVSLCLFVCLCVFMFLAYRSQFQTNLHETSPHGRVNHKQEAYCFCFSKILNFHLTDSKFEQVLHIRSMNSTTNYFWGQHWQNHKGLISKIVNFHQIDLKFEEDLQIWSLNSTTYYFCGQLTLPLKCFITPPFFQF